MLELMLNNSPPVSLLSGERYIGQCVVLADHVIMMGSSAGWTQWIKNTTD